MIRQLRKRFIRIAMASVTVVMVMLSLIVNVANFLSTDADLTEILDMICENQGTIPARNDLGNGNLNGLGSLDLIPGRKSGVKGKSFNQETPYSTRYVFLCFDGSGSLTLANLDHIAAITEADTSEYIAVALRHGPGYGYYGSYKYRVVQRGEDRYVAVFLDCYQELRAVKIVAACSAAAIIICVALVYVLVVFFSRKAIDPVVRSAQRQKQFITDASHELKTPVTVIATSLKVLEMETGKQKWIDKAVAQTERLKDLVNSLITLSRMNEEETPLKFEEFPISDAVRETADSFLDFAQSAGHALNITVAPDLRYCGDEYAVRQLVSILLDNAVKYASAGSRIDFSLEKAKKGVLIRSSNACVGMDSAELDKLFDRFYRSDKSRSAGGFGIGLSVARSIAEGHGGSIQAEYTEDCKIEFTVRLK